MKTNFFIAIAALLFIVLTSCKSKAQKDAENYMDKIEKTMKENPVKTDDQQKGNAQAFTIPQGMENIVGDWELVKVIGDHNANHKIDSEEEKNATTTLKDLLILNSDGSCQYTLGRIKARYEIVPEDDGRKKLVMYDQSGAKINRGRYIISVTSDELVIHRIMGGSDFEVFKRL